MVNYTGRGLVVKRPGGLSKVQMLNLVLGVGVFSLLPKGGVPIPSRPKSLQKLPFKKNCQQATKEDLNQRGT